jgi:hypothetical protein
MTGGLETAAITMTRPTVVGIKGSDGVKATSAMLVMYVSLWEYTLAWWLNYVVRRLSAKKRQRKENRLTLILLSAPIIERLNLSYTPNIPQRKAPSYQPLISVITETDIHGMSIPRRLISLIGGALCELHHPFDPR